jgi:glutamate dehydrogenase (NADP+)
MSRGGGSPRSGGGHVDLNGFMEGVKRRNPGQPEFVQAVQEVAQDIFEFIEDKEEYHRW